MEQIEKVVEQLLPLSAKSSLPSILIRLEEKGVEEVNDLKYLNVEEDLKGILKEVPARKFKEKIAIFFNGESSESAIQADTNLLEPACPPPLLHAIDWADNFQIPMEKLPKSMKNKLERGKRLTPSEYREFIRILVAGVLEVYDKPRKCHLCVIAKKVVEMFHSLKEMIDDKVVGTGYDGMLRKMIARKENLARETSESKERRLLEKKATKRSYGCVNFFPEETNVAHNEEKKKALQQEFQLLEWNCQKVDELMVETFASLRKDIIKQNSFQQLKTDWPFLFVSRYFFSHFKKLMGIDLEREMDCLTKDKIPDVMKFLIKEGSTIKDHNRYLEALASYFSEDATFIIRIFKDSSVKELVKNESTPVSPYIAAFGDPYRMEAICVLFIDRQEASEFVTLKEASSLWFASFYILGLEYPEECPATAEFIQRSPSD